MGPVGVRMVLDEGILDEGSFWKMWIGRASKNSWAMMKGVDVSSTSLVNGLWFKSEDGKQGTFWYKA
jgi:hypothetical protein